jgi:hypothetical protein
MKTVWRMKVLIALASLAVLGSPRAYAQFEVDPDHFEMTDAAPAEQAKTNTGCPVKRTHYQGSVTLPYSLQCGGKSLPPAKYSVSLSSAGRTAQLTLTRKGQVVRIAEIRQEQLRNRGRDALVLERSGSSQQLHMIQVAQVNFVLTPDPRVERTSDSEPRSIEKLPFILRNPPEQ